MKRYFSLFLGIVLILGMFGGSLAFADDPVVLDPPITIDPVEGGGFTITDSSGVQPAATIEGTAIEEVSVSQSDSTTMYIDTDKANQTNYSIAPPVDVTIQGDVNNEVNSPGGHEHAVSAGSTALVYGYGGNTESSVSGSVNITVTGNAIIDGNVAATAKEAEMVAVYTSTGAVDIDSAERETYATATDSSNITITVEKNAEAYVAATGDTDVSAYAVQASSWAETGDFDKGSATAVNNSTITVTVGGDAKAKAESSSHAEAYAVSAEAVAESGENGIAENNSKVTVTVSGNAEAVAKGDYSEATGVNANNATVNVGGDVTATAEKDATGIVAAKGASVTVGGDVQSSGDAIEVAITNVAGDEKSSVVVEGTVSAENHTLELKVSDAFDDTPENISTVINNLPEIIVQTISPDADIVVTAPNLSENSKAAVTNEMFAQISYIVTTNNMDEAKISIVGTDTKTVGDTTYVVAHENDTITVKNIGDGKIVGVQVGGENPIAQVQDNGDGSWTITVCRGGNLDINVTYEDAKQEEPEVQPVNITVTPSTGDVFTGPMLLTLGSGENSNVLTVNMVYINKTDILVSTFQNFANQGYDTVQVQTAGGIYSITMAELLSLANGGSLITFVIRGDLLEVYVDWQLVMTLALTRTSV
ncbi:MAG: hypothetical protein IJH70_04285 [Oscillospiraceae bacterium]|nr:hypothetical protein [Oscillospiraceae bacterium]